MRADAGTTCDGLGLALTFALATLAAVVVFVTSLTVFYHEYGRCADYYRRYVGPLPPDKDLSIFEPETADPWSIVLSHHYPEPSLERARWRAQVAMWSFLLIIPSFGIVVILGYWMACNGT